MATAKRHSSAYETKRQKYAKLLHRGTCSQSGHQHEITTTPLFTLKAKYLAENDHRNSLLPQYGVLGFHVGDSKGMDANEPILLNTNAPSSPELHSKDLSVERMNKLMAFSDSEGKIPLYMEVIQRILREMGRTTKKGEFSYRDFSKMLNDQLDKFSVDQTRMMDLRLGVLESFMVDRPRKSKDNSSLFNLKPGTLTIIDLTDPFVDASTACVLFDICLSLVKENAPSSGLVVALDEAHKYLNTPAAATVFTDRLLTTIREQRHNSTRVIIATQQSTMSEKPLDLCSVSTIHRFTSPAWFKAIKDHLSGASSLIADKEDREKMMDEIVNLNTGESVVFSPNSYLNVQEGKV